MYVCVRGEMLAIDVENMPELKEEEKMLVEVTGVLSCGYMINGHRELGPSL